MGWLSLRKGRVDGWHTKQRIPTTQGLIWAERIIIVPGEVLWRESLKINTLKIFRRSTLKEMEDPLRKICGHREKEESTNYPGGLRGAHFCCTVTPGYSEKKSLLTTGPKVDKTHLINYREAQRQRRICHPKNQKNQRSRDPEFEYYKVEVFR